MMKTLSKLLLFVMVICIVAVCGLVFVIVNLNVNDYKDKIAIRLSDEMQRPVSIEGDVNVTFYPWLGLDIGAVSIANAKGFTQETPFIKANHLKVRARLMPLLRKEIEMDTVDIDGAELYLEKNAEGKTNWGDLVTEKEREYEHHSDGTPPELGALILGGVKITNGAFSYKDAVTGQNVSISNITATTGELQYGEPIDLNVSMLAEANQPALKSDIKLNGVLNYNPDTEVYQLTPINFIAETSGKKIPGGKTTIRLIGDLVSDQGLGETQLNIKEFDAIGTKATMNVSITGKDIDEQIVAGSGNISSEDISKLFKAFEIEPLASELAKQKTRSINSNLSFNAKPGSGELTISEMTANLMGNELQGNILANNLNEEAPTVKGTLNAKGPNLPVLMQLIGQIQEGKDSNLAQIGKNLAKSKNKSFSLVTEFDTNLESGAVNIPSFSANGLGVKVRGKLQSNSRGVIQGDFKLEGEQPRELLSALGQADLAKVVQRIDVETTISGNNSAIALKPLAVTVTVSGKHIPNSPVALELNADTDINTKKQTLSLPRFSLQGLGLNLHGKVDVKNYASDLNLNGKVSIAEFDLKKLAGQLNQDLPTTTDKNVFKKVALNTSFSKTKDVMQIQNLNMRLDDSTINGSLSFSDNPKTPTQFKLNIDQIDADRYFPPSTEGKPKTPEAVASAAVQFPVETLRAHNFKGDVTIGKFVASKAKMQDVSLSVKANFGDIRMYPMTAKLYEGTYAADIKLNAKGDVPILSMSTQLEGIQAEPMLLDTTGQANLVGKGSFKANVTAAGANTQKLISSLSGNADLNFVDGILRGVDVAGALKQVELMIEQKRFGNIDKGEQTVFESLAGTMQIKNGVVTNKDMLMITPGFTVPGEGMLVNLNDETWKYDLTAKVDKTRDVSGAESYNLGGYDLPINCRGKIKELDCKPDAGGIAKLVLKTIGEDKVKDVINDLIGDTLPINIFGEKEETTKEAQQATPAEGNTEQQAQPDPVDALKDKAAEEIFKGLKKLF